MTPRTAAEQALLDWAKAIEKEAVRDALTTLRAAVEGLPLDAVCHRFHDHTDELPLPVALSRAAVLALIDEAQKGADE